MQPDDGDLRLRRLTGEGCGATLRNSYGKLSKTKSSENIDAALQHSHMSAQPRPTHHGRGRSGEADENDEIHACAGRRVDACADGCCRAGASGGADGQGHPVQLQPGHDRECVNAVRHRGRRGRWRGLKRSDLLWRWRQGSVLADALPVREAEQFAEPQLGRQPVLCGLLESEGQLQRRRQASHHAAQSARVLHRPADRSFDAAFGPDRDDRDLVRQGQFQCRLEHRHRCVRHQRVRCWRATS